MLVYVASHFLTYLCIGPLKGDPKAGQAETYPIHENVQASKLIAGTELHTGLLVILVVFIVLAAILLFTLLGYRLKVAQHTPRAERFAGFSPKNTVWLSFAISGGMAGLKFWFRSHCHRISRATASTGYSARSVVDFIRQCWCILYSGGTES